MMFDGTLKEQVVAMRVWSEFPSGAQTSTLYGSGLVVRKRSSVLADWLLTSGMRVGSSISCSSPCVMAKASVWRPASSVLFENLSQAALCILKSPMITISAVG